MKARNTKLVAEICLYGNGPSGCGCGWLLQTANGRVLGHGDPVKMVTWTDCLFAAVNQFSRATGIERGTVRVFMAGGQKMAEFNLPHTPYFGDLKWQPATMVTLNVGELCGAAS